MNTLLKLLRKDWRLNRVPVVALLIAVAGSYMVASLSWYMYRNSYNWLPYRTCLTDAATASIGIGTVIAAAFGGAAFAIERHERWADFLAMVPAPRWQVVLSKLLVGLGAPSLFAALNGAVILVANPDAFHLDEFPLNVGMIVCGYLSVFGVAWVFSTFLDSAAIAAGISIGAVFGSLMAAAFFRIIQTDAGMLHFFAMPMGIAGLLAIIGGCVYYARRVAP